MNANAPKLITLSCPSCGAKLEITPTLDRFACSFCGQEHIVNRLGDTISLSPVVEAIHQVKIGVDKTAAELAIVRLQKEISDLMHNLIEVQGVLKRILKPQGFNIGVNIGIVAPMAFFPFSGMKDSFFGILHTQGQEAVRFFTESKVVIQRWL